MLTRLLMTIRPQWFALSAATIGVGLVCLARQAPPRPGDLALAAGLVLYMGWVLHRDGRQATADGSTGCPWCDEGYGHAEPDAPPCC